MNDSLDAFIIFQCGSDVCRALNLGFMESDTARGSFVEDAYTIEDMGGILEGGSNLSRIGDVACELIDGGDRRGERLEINSRGVGSGKTDVKVGSVSGAGEMTEELAG